MVITIDGDPQTKTGTERGGWRVVMEVEGRRRVCVYAKEEFRDRGFLPGIAMTKVLEFLT